MARPIKMTKAQVKRIVSNTLPGVPGTKPKEDRKTPEQREHKEQVELFQTLVAPLIEAYPELDALFAVPNAAKRSPHVGAMMKAEGLKPGVWDVHWPVARKGYIGLWIEMKYGDNTLSPEQEYWRALMEALGHLCVVCYSSIEAFDALLDYAGITLPESDGRPSGLGAGSGDWREVILDPARLWDSIEPGEQREL
jgi:hypothetical protein